MNKPALASAPSYRGSPNPPTGRDGVVRLTIGDALNLARTLFQQIMAIEDDAA